MEEISVFILNENFVPFYIVSEFNSLIWTDRYWECGDFQLETIYTLDAMRSIKIGQYVSLGDSSNLMVIESINISYDPADKTSQLLTYKGRSLESILDRRIIWGKWGSTSRVNVQTRILGLINDAIVNPKDGNRRISFFKTRTVTGITGSQYEYATVGDSDNLYDVVKTICKTAGVGMRCDYSEMNGDVTFSLFLGSDRSYDQSILPPVIFSSAYENLGPSRFSINTTEYKTIAFAVGPWSGNTRTELVVGNLYLSGLDRREVFVESGSDGIDAITDAAMSELADRNQFETLDSELDSKRQFVYGKDFFIGDIVQVITDFGLDKKARVTEFIRSWDEGGYTEVPTFEIVEED